MNMSKESHVYQELKETEEGVEVNLFLQNLRNFYCISDVVGTYVCSKVKNFLNNFRHKTKRAIYEELKANEIVSGKLNAIIDSALKESNFEKLFEYYSGVSYSQEFDEKSLPISNIDSVKSKCVELPSNINQIQVNECKVSSQSHLVKPSSKSSNSDNKYTSTKRAFVDFLGESHLIHLRKFDSVNSLKILLALELNIDSEDLINADIKCFDKNLKTWYYLESWALLNADENIRIFYPDEIVDHTHPHIDMEEVCDVKTQDPPFLDIQENNLEIPLEKLILDVLEEYKSSGGKQPWIKNFKLPKFHTKIKYKMNQGIITSNERQQICQIIHDSIKEYDSHPTSNEIKVVLKCLFISFPKLTEQENDYWVTWNIWKASIEKTFAENNDLKEKQKQTPKKRVLKRSPKHSTTLKKRRKNEKSSESDRSLEMHNNEQSSEVQCLERFSAAMSETFEDRRMQIISEAWSVQDIFISYPWLHSENEIFAEFARIVGFDWQVDKAIDVGFCKITNPLLHILKHHQKAQIILDKEKELKSLAKKKKSLDFEYKMTLFALPLAVGEDIDTIFVQAGSYFEEPIQIVYADSEHYDSGKSYSVIIEDIRIECSSIKKAVAVYFSSFFIFNLAYPSDIKKFLYAIERNILNLPGRAAAPPAVNKLFLKIDEYFN